MSTPPRGMRCWVYRGGRDADTYLYLASRDGFESVPEALLRALGRLELALELELTPERRLARAQAGEVLAALAERGYYLQLPPVDRPATGQLQ